MLYFGAAPRKEKIWIRRYKQRISLYLDREVVERMDSAVKKYGYRSRNEFVSSAVDNLIADKLLGENDTVISEKLSKAIAEMSEAQTLQIAKSMFRYAVEMELIMRMFSETYGLYSERN